MSVPTLEEFTALQKKLADIQQARDKAAGAGDELRKQAQESFETGTLEEIRNLLVKKQKLLAKAEKRRDALLEELKTEFQEVLKDEDKAEAD